MSYIVRNWSSTIFWFRFRCRSFKIPIAWLSPISILFSSCFPHPATRKSKIETTHILQSAWKEREEIKRQWGIQNYARACLFSHVQWIVPSIPRTLAILDVYFQSSKHSLARKHCKPRPANINRKQMCLTIPSKSRYIARKELLLRLSDIMELRAQYSSLLFHFAPLTPNDIVTLQGRA